MLRSNPPLNTPPRVTALATFNVAAETSETAPVNVSEPEFNALPSPMVPDIASAFVTERLVVESLESAPPSNLNEPVPRAALPARLTVPAFNVSPPVKVFVPESVSTEEPVFETEPPVPTIAPLSTEFSEPPIVSRLLCRLIVPEPARLPISSDASNRSAALPATVTATELSNADPPASTRLPPPTKTGPEKVFVPENVTNPAPVLVNP